MLSNYLCLLPCSSILARLFDSLLTYFLIDQDDRGRGGGDASKLIPRAPFSPLSPGLFILLQIRRQPPRSDASTPLTLPLLRHTSTALRSRVQHIHTYQCYTFFTTYSNHPCPGLYTFVCFDAACSLPRCVAPLHWPPLFFMHPRLSRPGLYSLDLSNTTTP